MKIYEKFYLNKLKSKKIFKIIISLCMVLIILSCGVFYEAYKYNRLISDFKKDFGELKFSQANNLLLTKQEFNPFKVFMLQHDISKFFNAEINTLYNKIEDGSISSEVALIELKEIDRYNLVSDSVNSVINSIDSIQNSVINYTNGMNYFNNEQYYEAISSLKNVSSLDLNYPNSLKYLNESKNRIKENLLNKCDDLVKNDYYTQALSILHNSNDILGEDNDIKEKISEIKVQKQQYLDKNSTIAEASSKALIATISSNNINKLNVESITSYLVNVNLKEQKTYIYKGTANNWNLTKTFPCSTGISGKDTPYGSFSIKERGDWFFSEKYNQGGKYWTQITGNILFHSVPFAKDKTTIVDYTLNKPSSHGCIRLSVDDAKWIYTNIPRGSKVIIK